MKDTAVLLIDCPDRKGLVARVAGMLYERGANILHADQHQDHDLGLFFMRVEWALNSSESKDRENRGGSRFDLAAFKEAFAPLAAELDMRWRIESSQQKPRVALFCSQYLHCVADLLHRWQSRELDCDIPVIVSNHREVERLAAFYDIPFEHVPVSAATRGEAEEQETAILEQHGVELVVLARYMQILSPAFVAQVSRGHHQRAPLVPAGFHRRASVSCGTRAWSEADRGNQPLRDRGAG